MKRSRIFITFILGIAVGALAAVGIYFLTVGEVVWQEYVETKLIPNVVLALSAISALCVAALPIISKIQATLLSFNQATKDVNATVENDKTVVAILGEYKTELAAMTEEVKSMRDEVKATVSATQHTADNIEKVVRIGFCNTDELVRKGYAREIGKVGAVHEQKEA